MNKQLVTNASNILRYAWVKRGNLARFFQSYTSRANIPRHQIPSLRRTVFGVFKWKRLLDYLQGGKKSWENTVRCFLERAHLERLSDSSIKAAVRCSCPDDVFEELCDTLGKGLAFKTAIALNSNPSNTIRVNTNKITRAELLLKLSYCGAVPCVYSPTGINIPGSTGRTGMALKKKGYFEWQDEASQQVAGLVQPKPNDLILDYCAGAGGKTLAIACSNHQESLRFVMHDVRSSARDAAIQRLKRAGVAQWEYHLKRSDLMSSYQAAADWVVVDAPCTGTGAWRRDPSLKWQTGKRRIERCAKAQRLIFGQALEFLADQGKIMYSTCSILASENERQVDTFCRTHNLEVVGTVFRSNPAEGHADGLFGVVLKRA